MNGRQDNWVDCITKVEQAHNNLPNAATGKLPNQILYGCNTRTALDVALPSGRIMSDKLKSFVHNQEAIRLEVLDALAFAAARMKV